MNEIKNNINRIWQQIDDWMNSDEKLISSEKSIVFNFAWLFSKQFESNVLFIDFETNLFQHDFSDGQFLDLFIKYQSGNKELRIGIEFKYPNKKESGSNHTVTRQKIINDIKRLNWLVEKDKIDIGCFLCLTNENNYIRIGNYKVATNFLTHHGQIYKQNFELPTNDFFLEKVNSLNNIEFNWKNVNSSAKKYAIENKKYSFLEPIFITK
jgi:hypothetical protein